MLFCNVKLILVSLSVQAVAKLTKLNDLNGIKQTKG